MAEEENQKLTLEDYLRELEGVDRSDSVDRLTEYYNRFKNKPGSDLTEVYHKLGKKVAGDEDTFVQATDSGILGNIHNWQWKRPTDKDGKVLGPSTMEKVAASIDKYKPKIFEDYTKILSGLIAVNRKGREEELAKRIEKEQSGLDPEVKKKIIEENVYLGLHSIIGEKIYNLPASNSYSESNPEVYGLIQQIKELEGLRDENRTEELKSRMVEAKGLPSSFALLPVANKWAGNVDQQISVFKRIIGAHFVDKEGNLNTNELEAYTRDSVKSYRRMGSEVYNTYTEAAQQSKR